MILLSASGVAPDGLETEITGCIAKGSPVCELVDPVKQARGFENSIVADLQGNLARVREA